MASNYIIDSSFTFFSVTFHDVEKALQAGCEKSGEHVHGYG